MSRLASKETVLPQTKLRYATQIVVGVVAGYVLALWAIDTAKLLVYAAAFVCTGIALQGAVGLFNKQHDSSRK